MTFLEKDLEDIIWETDNEKLRERGIYISGKKYRQFKIGNYGIADIVTFDRSYLPFSKTNPYLVITVYELKKDKIGISAFLQAIKYIKGLQRYFQNHKPSIEVVFNMVLCGKELDKSGSFLFISDMIGSEFETGYLNSIQFYTYKYNLDGLTFEQHYDYSLTEEGF